MLHEGNRGGGGGEYRSLLGPQRKGGPGNLKKTYIANGAIRVILELYL